jgi:spermidine synthase
MIRSLALALTVLTGFSGLVYEVAWQKLLATLLGSHGEATAAVLAIFLGGLSAGYAIFGKITRRVVVRAAAAGRPARLLVGYGLIETAIGLYAFSFNTLFEWAQAISFAVPLGSSGAAFAFDVVLAALLIGPPSVLMGGTIPILTQALARSLEDATRFHAMVYAFNTAGAFVGALAAGFWLVPWLGLVGVLSAVGWLNVGAGAGFIGVGWVRAVSPATGGGAAPRVEGFGAYALVAALTGFAMMAIQVVFIRLGGVSLGSSHFTFSMVVAVFVLCIALGSLAVSALSRIPAGVIVANQWALVLLLTLLYSFLGDAPYWAHALRSLYRDQPAGFHPYYANVFFGLLVTIGPPVVLSGAALPLLFHHLRRQVGDLGAVAGRLYSWNTVGSLLGALLGGYVLFYWLDLHAVYRVAVGALVVAALILSLRVLRFRRRAWVGALAIPALVSIVMLAPWEPVRLASGAFRFRGPQPSTYHGADAYFDRYRDVTVLFYDDDPAMSVAVMDHPMPNKERSLAIFINGKPDSSIGLDYTTMALLALLPATMADRVERAFVIGYGTGVTAGEFAALDSVREVVVAEISSGVVRAAPLFEEHNLGAATNPKVRIVRGDAYRALLRSEGTYDVISSEPSNPWVTGTEMLYSRDFLRAARGRLNPGGIYVQWFHSYETDDETVELIIKTFASVFDSVAVWYSVGPDLLLLGFAEESDELELGRIMSRARQPDISAGLERAGIDDVPALLAHELFPLGVVEALELEGSVHTLLHPILSDRAARAFFQGGWGRLPRTANLRPARAGARNSLIRQLAMRNGGRLTEEARSSFASETCKHRTDECAVVLAQWLEEEPDSSAGKRLLGRSRRRPEQRQTLAPRALAALKGLFDDASPVPGRSVSAAAVESATQTFRRYYHHSAPFERAALHAMWSACERDPAQEEACRRGRAAAEELLGDFEADLSVTTESVEPADPAGVVGVPLRPATDDLVPAQLP